MIYMTKLVYGVGINDADYVVVPRTPDGKRKYCPFYLTWMHMLERGYCEKFKARQPTYKDVTVCEEWHRFSAFKAWMETQDWEGKSLDKDILVPGNKEYGPEVCCFVGGNVNNFIIDRGAGRGKWPLGVHLHRDKFRASLSVFGRRTHLGYFCTPEEAHLAWAKAKRRLLDELITNEGISEYIASALRRKYDEILTLAENKCAIIYSP